MDEQALKKSLVASFCEFLEEEKDESIQGALKTLKESKTLYDDRFKPSTPLLEILREYHQKASKQTKKSGNFPYNQSFENVKKKKNSHFKICDLFTRFKKSVKVEDRSYYLKSYKACLNLFF
jgi:HD-GYP domain-containing protein (c-di-GMP phosphodiesterase class II)